MKNIYLKVFTGSIALYLFGVSLWGFESLNGFYLAVGIALAAIGALHWRRGIPPILPLLLALGYFGSLAVLSWLPGKILLGLLVAIFYYFYATASFHDEPATLGAGFLLLLFIWGMHFIFTPDWYISLLLVLVLFLLLFAEIFYKMGKTGRDLAIYALVSALLLTEVAWAEFYLPVHFFTAAVISFSVFYGIYVGSREYFSGKLTRKKVYFQVSIIVIVLALTLFSSPWLPSA